MDLRTKEVHIMQGPETLCGLNTLCPHSDFLQCCTCCRIKFKCTEKKECSSTRVTATELCVYCIHCFWSLIIKLPHRVSFT